MTDVIDPLQDAFIVRYPSVTGVVNRTSTASTANGARIVDIRDVKIEELEKKLERLTWRVQDLEGRIYGSTEKYGGD